MSTTIGTFQVIDSQTKPHQFAIQKNNQNRLKGLVWAAAATALTGGALAATGAAFVFGAMNATLAIAYPSTIPLALIGTAAVAALDYLAISITGNCFNNAIHHLGPKFQIVKL
jgi:hypothetical protein